MLQELPSSVLTSLKEAVAGCHNLKKAQDVLYKAKGAVDQEIMLYDSKRTHLLQIMREHNIPCGTFIIEGSAVRVRKGANEKGNLGISEIIGTDRENPYL